MKDKKPIQDFNPNKEIWDKLKETDPRFTKRINKGFGDITTIDPQWQIMKMTETFGPIGKGWGYIVDYQYLELREPIVIAEVKIWWSEENKVLGLENYTFGPISSSLKLFKKNGSYDDEAGKKCMTDALTKGFSHLGLCSDVFMGLFDNSKYVQKLEDKIAQQSTPKLVTKIK